MQIQKITVGTYLGVTYSCLGFHMKLVFCIYDAFDDDFRIKRMLGKCLKESCRLGSKEQFSFNYFPKASFVTKKTSQK